MVLHRRLVPAHATHRPVPLLTQSISDFFVVQLYRGRAVVSLMKTYGFFHVSLAATQSCGTTSSSSTRRGGVDPELSLDMYGPRQVYSQYPLMYHRCLLCSLPQFKKKVFG